MFGSLVAVFQSDMKKVIAYSTTSQLGYLCWSCGLSNFFGALFHLFVHAFFKSTLFLTAGLIVPYELNIQKLGGFTTIIPLSYSFTLISLVSLIGWPNISGYFSKEYILCSSYYGWSDLFLFYISNIAIHLTVYYSSKLIISQFWNIASYGCI
jgi:NADH-quinone oxidoreductase subunit L